MKKGTGIAGLSVAYNLKVQGIETLMITKTEKIYESNSVIAPANMRMFEDINQGIDLYMAQCNGNYEMITNEGYVYEIVSSSASDIEVNYIGTVEKN